MIVHLLVEGSLDEAVAERLLQEACLEKGTTFGKQGYGYIKNKVNQFYMATRTPLLTLVDFMDTRELCVALAASKWIGNQPTRSLFRLVVREIESWLLADHDAIATFLNLPISKIPTAPEDLADPKQTLINLARKSKRKVVRDMLLPESGTSAIEGPFYNTKMIEFVHQHWRPRTAAQNAPSLARCLSRLDNLNR